MSRHYGRLPFKMDDDDMFVPSIPEPRRDVRGMSGRPTPATLFPQERSEARAHDIFATKHATITYDAESEALIADHHVLREIDWANIKHGLAAYNAHGHIVRRIILYLHPDTYREVYFELKRAKYDRRIAFEKDEGPYRGKFAVVRERKRGLAKPQEEDSIE